MILNQRQIQNVGYLVVKDPHIARKSNVIVAAIVTLVLTLVKELRECQLPCKKLRISCKSFINIST